MEMKQQLHHFVIYTKQRIKGYLKNYNKEFSEDMLVVCEEFEVIYN